ncbi:transporter substrate-binding domain-containing protein [Roseovarius pelagicus]|uniref:Transporter substrate-binding domain-containing protein n=1 Tax=Roseovarius pelagicus TaxID=2980108 RepID=A0ABY6DCP5_9RHOB|nr:transporter substrate-binding domain-containing protein [Roseovarius pelagicus]UXX82783.1 transporter substrate-binding domain-containing protein [Roseovarius pelagicus]
MFHKLKIATGLIAVLAAVPALADGDLEVAEPGVLTCGADGGYPPFSLTNTKGEFDGLAVRVMKEMATRAGLEYSPVIVKWDSALVGVLSGKFDMLCNAMDITAARQEQVRFIDGWLESGGRLLVHEDSDVSTPDEFDGVIGVLASSTWAELAKELNASDTKYYKVEVDAMRDLANGNIDGMITDAIAAAWAIEQSNLPIKLTEGSLSSIQKGFALHKDKVNLAKALNKALASMVEDGTYAELTSDLIGFSPAPEEPIRSQF